MSERQWENAGDVFWWADMPLRDSPDLRQQRFGRQQSIHAPLHDFLCCIGATGVSTLLDHVDWGSIFRGYRGANQSVGIDAIVSIPREHHDCRFGLKRLGQVLGRLNPRFPKTGCPVQIQCWSIGGSNEKWYRSFVSHVTQDFNNKSGHVERLPSDAGVRMEVQTPGRGACRSFDQRMVTRACLWEDPCHPPMAEDKTQDSREWGWHSKVMYRLYPAGICKAKDCTRAHGWANVGSHNCSASSWGYIKHTRTTAIKNFEIGLVISSLPAVRPGIKCGLDLHQSVMIPWTYGTVSSISDDHTSVKLQIKIQYGDIGTDDVEDHIAESEEENSDDSKHPQSHWKCVPLADERRFHVSRRKWLKLGAGQSLTPKTGPRYSLVEGTTIKFDFSLDSGIVDIYEDSIGHEVPSLDNLLGGKANETDDDGETGTYKSDASFAM